MSTPDLVGELRLMQTVLREERYRRDAESYRAGAFEAAALADDGRIATAVRMDAARYARHLLRMARRLEQRLREGLP